MRVGARTLYGTGMAASRERLCRWRARELCCCSLLRSLVRRYMAHCALTGHALLQWVHCQEALERHAAFQSHLYSLKHFSHTTLRQAPLARFAHASSSTFFAVREQMWQNRLGVERPFHPDTTATVAAFPWRAGLRTPPKRGAFPDPSNCTTDIEPALGTASGASRMYVVDG